MILFLRAGLFFAFLFVSQNADAVCGDVNGDGNRSAVDALAVLKAATGQTVELACAGEGPSDLRFFNDWDCVSGSDVAEASFNGFTFQANAGGYSAYQSVDRESIDTIVVEFCGGDYNFPGPLNLPPDRKISFYVALLDPEVYGEGRALFVLYDDGEAASALMTGETDILPASGIGYAFGDLVTR
jgi:hypothetical protein